MPEGNYSQMCFILNVQVDNNNSNTEPTIKRIVSEAHHVKEGYGV